MATGRSGPSVGDQVCERGHDAMRRLEDDQRRFVVGVWREEFAARGAGAGQKAQEAERVGRQAGGDQRGDHATRRRARAPPWPADERVADQREAGIGDAGRARVGDQRHVAVGQAIDAVGRGGRAR